MANQKLGKAKPNWLSVMTPTSPVVFCLEAAYKPRHKAMTIVMPMAMMAKGRVTCRRSSMRAAVGVS